jgi:hypothetical protein
MIPKVTTDAHLWHPRHVADVRREAAMISLRLLNRDRVYALPAGPEDRQRLQRLLYRNLIRR